MLVEIVSYSCRASDRVIWGCSDGPLVEGGPELTQFHVGPSPDVALTAAFRSVLHNKVSSTLALSII